MDNATLIDAFVDGVVTHRIRQRSSPDLTIEAVDGHWQLLARTEGLVAISMLAHSQPRVAIRYRSAYWKLLHDAMFKVRYLPTGKSQRAGFYEYQQLDIPPGYQVQFSDALDIMQAWWSYQSPDTPASLISMLVLHRSTWHPVRDVTCNQGTLLIHTLGHTVKLLPLERLAWLQRRNLTQRSLANGQRQNTVIALPPVKSTPKAEPQASTRNLQSGRPPSPASQNQAHHQKMGSYLIEADLITPAQVEVALRDQRSTGLKFGEILVQRGWLKQKTIEFLMERVILPQRAAARQSNVAAPSNNQHHSPLQQRHYPHQPGQTATDPSSIHSRETLITDRSVINDAINAGHSVSPASETAAIHSRATLITEPLDLEPTTETVQPSDEALSIHSRETLITDNLTDLLETAEQDLREDLSVHSRETLITDKKLQDS